MDCSCSDALQSRGFEFRGEGYLRGRAFDFPEYAADTLAQCYQSADDEESAEKHYRQAIMESPGDSGVLRRFADFCLESGRKTRAISLLERLVSKDFEEKLDDQMWGRRNLALSIGLKGNRENTERALGLIELNLELSDSSTEDLRCLAILLAKDPRPEKADEGLKILLNVEIGRAHV